ncbi:MAG: DNA-protecting protein DprA, partial [Candidatus Eremiobacteraeota bacterium]|nr:DNA-protecting protein DprA [Candidatus Eremiobacteraeota bacterium]
GALNTAGWAAGRIPVLAVPGDVDRKHAAGCLALIRDGATLARDAGDVLESIGLSGARRRRAATAPADPVQAAMVALLRDGSRPLDDLLAHAGVDPARALAAVTRLELEGRLERRGTGEYALVC